MEAVFLSDDEEAKAVTARVPLIASETARYREGLRLRARQVGPLIRRAVASIHPPPTTRSPA